MKNLTLNEYDSLEEVLPTVELAMQSGETCQIRNIEFLGRAHLAALCLLAMSENLMDLKMGEILHPHPGFRLLAVDEQGATQNLVQPRLLN